MGRSVRGQLKPRILGLSLLAVPVVFVTACAGSSVEPSPGATSTTSEPVSSASSELGSSATLGSGMPAWATSTVVEVDPITLAPVGPPIPAGDWVEGSAVTDDVIAMVTWALEEVDRPDSRWRLVVASRETGELLFDERVGDMNILGMFPASSGEVVVVEPIRSADRTVGDGFVVHSHDPATGELREAARFDEGDFQPRSLTLLSDGRLGLVGAERNGDLFDRLRIVVFDWEANEAVTDVSLNDLPLDGDAPDGVFVDQMHHPVVWDEAQSRALVIHAHEDVVTTVGVPNGKVEEVVLAEGRSLLDAFLGWLVPPAHAKGLPSHWREAVVSGDHIYIAGTAVTFEPNGDGTYSYTYSATDLLKVEIETLRIVDRAEIGVTTIAASRDGGYLLGGGKTISGQVGEQRTTTGTEEHTDLLVIDPETLDVVDRHEEAQLTAGHQAQAGPAPNTVYLTSTGNSLLVFNTATGHLTSTDAIGAFESPLLENSLRYASHASQ